jgi:ureidoacrylate peracid hydrolase
MALSDLDAAASALLVVDMQNAFCHPEGTLGISGVDVSAAQGVVEPVRRLCLAFEAAGVPVVWTRQVHLGHDVSRARKALAPHTAKRKRVSALAGSWDAQLVDQLAGLATDPAFVVTKHRFGAFYQTRLDPLLAMLGVRALFVVGVTANACVETTLREAYLRDYDVVAVTDAIAAVRPQWFPVAQEVWAQYLGELATADEVCEWLLHATSPRARKLHHVALQVSDLQRSLDFYVRLLGFTLTKREAFRDSGKELAATAQGLGLVGPCKGTGPESGTLEHLCFEATGVDTLAENAKANGYKIVRGPGPGPYGRTVYIEDPDGNEVELVEVARE